MLSEKDRCYSEQLLYRFAVKKAFPFQQAYREGGREGGRAYPRAGVRHMDCGSRVRSPSQCFPYPNFPRSGFELAMTHWGDSFPEICGLNLREAADLTPLQFFFCLLSFFQERK